MKKQQALISLLIVGAVFTSMVLAAWLLPSKDFSDSERRRLAQRPEFSLSEKRTVYVGIREVHSGSVSSAGQAPYAEGCFGI